MSRRVKDRWWDLGIPAVENWKVHAMSPLGTEFLLQNDIRHDDRRHRHPFMHSEFLRVFLHPEGHNSSSVVGPRGMKAVMYCDYLPDGGLFVLGHDSGEHKVPEAFWHPEGSYYYEEEHEVQKEEFFGRTAMVATVLDGPTAKPRGAITLSLASPEMEPFRELVEYLVEAPGGGWVRPHQRIDDLRDSKVIFNIATVGDGRTHLRISSVGGSHEEVNRTVIADFARDLGDVDVRVLEGAGHIVGDSICILRKGERGREEGLIGSGMWNMHGKDHLPLSLHMDRNSYDLFALLDGFAITEGFGGNFEELPKRVFPLPINSRNTNTGDGNHFLAYHNPKDSTPQSREPCLQVRSFENEADGKGPVMNWPEFGISWPKTYPDRNWGNYPGIASATLHSGDTLALVFDGRRVVHAIRRGVRMDLKLNFGRVSSPERMYENGLMMAFTDDGSRLLTVLHVPNFSGKYWHGKKHVMKVRDSDEIKASYRWMAKSWDIDGRVSEMRRTKLRLEGRWEAQSERKSRSDALTKAGLPIYVANLIALHGISDEDGIALFRHLRQGGVPAAPPSDRGGHLHEEPLARIDEMAFTGAIDRDDARFLVENRQHAELVLAIAETDLDVDYARWLLVERGFSDHPDAVRRVLEGADVDRVAMVEGIGPGRAPPVEAPAGPEEEEDGEPEQFKPARKRFRRRGRFG